MNLNTIVRYSFVVIDEYKDLEDGTPNFYHTPAVKISNEGTIEQFLNAMKKNSKVDGLSIVDINYEIV